MRALIFGDPPGNRYKAIRSLRVLKRSGLAAEDATGEDSVALAERICASEEPIWLIRAGAWPLSEKVAAPPPSATGRPVMAFGAVASEETTYDWVRFLHATGGDIPAEIPIDHAQPELASIYLDGKSAAAVAKRLDRGATVSDAAWNACSGRTVRAIHHSAFDVGDDPQVRILQVVTSLQRGGAERLTLDLAAELQKRGHFCPIVTLGRPMRAAFVPPAAWLDLWPLRDRGERSDAIRAVAAANTIDVIHGHLLDRDDLVLLSRLGWPLVVTVHNTRPGWPAGLEDLRADDATLLVACAQAVETELRQANIRIPIRTIWNGIDFSTLERTPRRLAEAVRLRTKLGIGRDDFVLLALANPRPQKRLNLLPAILAATQARLPSRTVRLLLAGQASEIDSAQECLRQIHAEIERNNVAERVMWLGAVEDVASVLLASDVLVSTSAHEGLSLAQLEALVAGIAVVASDAGGTAEAAVGNPACQVVPLDASPEKYAQRLAEIAESPPPSGRQHAARHFTRERMVERYAGLYRRAIEAAHGPKGDGLWLITNNFSVGGAQSSARRLLLGLAAQGVRVRAAVLEEQANYPTSGHRELLDGGIPVVALPPGGHIDPTLAVNELLQQIDADPPECVLFWNALAEYKLLLADALIGMRIFDVSPGEMFFASLERYFGSPRPGLPYRCPADYGRRLYGIIVKYKGEENRAAELGAQVHVIPNGVPLPPPSPPRPASDRLVIGTLARINPQKKLEQLLAALRLAHGRLPPHVLRIAGGVERGCDDYAAFLRKQADGMNVEWLGERESLAFLQELDVFAMISEPAGCPNGSLEAMACSLPVIATDVGGASEQVIDGETGRLVPRGDVEGFAAGLIELAGDTAKRRDWGTAGRRRIEQCFSVGRMVVDYRRVCLST